MDADDIARMLADARWVHLCADPEVREARALVLETQELLRQAVMAARWADLELRRVDPAYSQARLH